MNTFTKSVFIMLVVSAKAGKILDSSASAEELYTNIFEEDLAHVDGDDFLTDGRSNQRRGSSYCTYSPDYDCYRHGWPECCQENNGQGCPREQPQCDSHRPPNPRPGKATRRPTKRPTPNPTPRPNDRRPTDTCMDDERPRPIRDGQRFRFNLVDEDAQCVDIYGRTYQWGQFNNCQSFSECADLCVNNAPGSLAANGSFRGYDFDCEQSVCRCLYDSGTLNNKNSGRFNRVNRNEPGRGSISGATRKKYSYCGKLVGAEFLENVVAEA